MHAPAIICMQAIVATVRRGGAKGDRQHKERQREQVTGERVGTRGRGWRGLACNRAAPHTSQHTTHWGAAGGGYSQSLESLLEDSATNRECLQHTQSGGRREADREPCVLQSRGGKAVPSTPRLQGEGRQYQALQGCPVHSEVLRADSAAPVSVRSNCLSARATVDWRVQSARLSRHASHRQTELVPCIPQTQRAGTCDK